MRAISVLAVVTLVIGCGGDSAGIDEIAFSMLGTWTGTTSGGTWLEFTIIDEADGCCSRVGNGHGRLTGATGDTIPLTLFSLNNTNGVVVNLRDAADLNFGQFKGTFGNASTLAGTVVGPEDFGSPPAGPFTTDTVEVTLLRE